MIREMKEDDIDDIIEIYWENYEEMFGVPRDTLKRIDERIWGRNYPFLSKENLKKGIGRYKVIVFEEKGKVLGFLMYYDNGRIFIDEIHVKRGHRRRGIGSKLLEFALSKGKDVSAHVSEDSLGFFIKHGFEIKGWFIGYLGKRWYKVERKV